MATRSANIESNLSNFLKSALTARAKTDLEAYAETIGMNYQWCQSNEDYGTKRMTVLKDSDQVQIQWGSGGPKHNIRYFDAGR